MSGKPPLSIFISYSRTDSAFVDRLENDLKARGFQPWVDRRKLEGGQDWMDELQKAIQQCQICVVVVSPQAVASTYVKMEYRYASSQKKLIIPAICLPTPIEAIPIDLNNLQWVNFLSSYDQGLAELLSTLSHSGLIGLALGATLLTYQGHSNSVVAVAWSPDGKYIASSENGHGGKGGTVQIWDTISGINKLTYLGHFNRATCLAWSPDGRYIASGGGLDRTVQIWNPFTGEKLLTYQGHHNYKDAYIESVAWSPDGNQIISGGYYQGDGGGVHMWEARSGKLQRIYYGFAHAADWAPDGKRIAFGEETVKILDASTGSELVSCDSKLKPELDPSEDYNVGSLLVRNLAWSSDGKRIAADNSDNIIGVYDALTGKVLLAYHGHPRRVTTLDWSPNGRYIASADWNDGVQIWDASTGKPFFTYSRTGNSPNVGKVAWSPDSANIALAGWDGTVKIWRAS